LAAAPPATEEVALPAASPAELVTELTPEATDSEAEASSDEMLDWTDSRAELAELLSHC
jgi:hypothetical protein